MTLGIEAAASSPRDQVGSLARRGAAHNLKSALEIERHPGDHACTITSCTP
jgi:hypothetical protein